MEKIENKLIDSFGRVHNYLRISLTDRCNFKCTYCKPENNYKHLKKEKLLTFEEIKLIVEALSEQGINKVRLTGGEPLLRNNLLELIEMLSSIDSLKDLSMTTNGHYLKGQSKELHEKGLKRINISLDTLNPLKFEKITGSPLKNVLEAIDEARDAGFSLVKINTVLLKGTNDNEVIDLIDFAKERELEIRFIESMPMASGFDWIRNYISIEDILKKDKIREKLDLSFGFQMKKNDTSFTVGKGGSKVGFISPMSKEFCDGCNRLRLTSDGMIRSCLTKDSELDLKKAVRKINVSKEEIISLVKEALLKKPLSSDYFSNDLINKRQMVAIGG